MPTFRPATNSDADAIRTLVFGVLAEYGLSPDPSGTDADLRDIEASYHSAGGTFDLLVDTNGFILGTVALCRVTDSECELRKMYLVREARGKGYGRRLLEQGIESSKKLGFTRITLETASVFHRKLREGSMTQSEYHLLRAQFETDISNGLWSWLPLSTSLVDSSIRRLGILSPDVFLRSADTLHLVSAADHGFTEIYSSDRHLLTAAPHFGLKGIKL